VKSFTHSKPFRGETDVWLTPPEIIDALGPFDLDPCAAPEPRPWPTARVHYSEADNGFMRPWEGFVWMNPPYGPQLGDWLGRLAGHPGGGIALTFARTETEAFHRHVWPVASGLYFLRGRLTFYRPDGTIGPGNGGAPSVLSGFGDEALRRLASSPLNGHLVVSSAAIILRADGSAAQTWREALEDALAGRELRLRDIYRAAEATPKVRRAKAHGHNWRSQIRRALQVYFKPVQRGVWAPA